MTSFGETKWLNETEIMKFMGVIKIRLTREVDYNPKIPEEMPSAHEENRASILQDK